MNNKITQLQNAVDYTENMLTNANSGNWDKVIEIECQRNALLEALFSTSSQQNDVIEIDKKIRKIIEINTQLEAITLNAREDTRKELMSINKGRNAVKAYARHGVSV